MKALARRLARLETIPSREPGTPWAPKANGHDALQPAVRPCSAFAARHCGSASDDTWHDQCPRRRVPPCARRSLRAVIGRSIPKCR